VSFAVCIDTVPPAWHRRFRLALGAFALAASVFALVFADAPQRAWIALAAILCLVAALARAAVGAAPAQGRLAIDETGRACWSDVPDRGRGARPVCIERWHLLGPLAWLRLRFEGEGTRFDALLARPAAAPPRRGDGENDWRRLRAWLLWYGRGAVSVDARPDPGAAPQ